jgi:cytochrome c biogenesis protein CcmG/thiol:disulfide interchange protein DsbE
MANTKTPKAKPPASNSGSSGGKSKTGIIIAAVGAVVVLLLIAVVMFGNSEVGAEYGEPEIEGNSLPQMPSDPQDLSATGIAYPKVSGQDFEGDPVVIENDGRAKAIVFLAHWCPHCQAEVPRVHEWLNAGGGDEDVDFYSVSTSMNSAQPNYPPSEWLAPENWQIPIIRDNQAGSAHSAYGAGGFPFWVFTNSDGTVALRTSGELQIDQLEQIIASLN